MAAVWCGITVWKPSRRLDESSLERTPEQAEPLNEGFKMWTAVDSSGFIAFLWTKTKWQKWTGCGRGLRFSIVGTFLVTEPDTQDRDRGVSANLASLHRERNGSVRLSLHAPPSKTTTPGFSHDFCDLLFSSATICGFNCDAPIRTAVLSGEEDPIAARFNPSIFFVFTFQRLKPRYVFCSLLFQPGYMTAVRSGEAVCQQVKFSSFSG